MIVCPNCNHQNPDGSSHCEACFTPLPSTTSCPNCGAGVQADATFCGQCGTGLKPGGATSGFPDLPPLPVIGELSQPIETLVVNPGSSSTPGEQPLSPTLVSSPDPIPPQPIPAPIPDPAATGGWSTPDPVSPPIPDPLAAPIPDPLPPPIPDPIVAPTPDPVMGSMPDPVPPPMPVPMPQSGMASTQLQLQSAKLMHVQTNEMLELPINLSVIHIGKPNDQVPPDIDVSGFPNSEIVSRIHADIRVEGDAYFIEDVGSSNGTYVNHNILAKGNRHKLRAGDRISLGKGDLVTFLFQNS